MLRIQLRVTAIAAAFVAGLGLLAVAAGPADASVRTIACNDGGNLQSALDATASGGTVKVSGVCLGNFAIAKNVTIVGSPSAVLDGGYSGAVLDIAPSLKVTLSQLSIEDGFNDVGGGMHVGDSTHLLLSHVSVSHNEAYYTGGGMWADHNTVVTVSHSVFSFNTAALQDNTPVDDIGGAISSGGTVVVGRSAFSDNLVDSSSPNSSAQGGAIFVTGKLTVTNSTFARNVVRGTIAQGGSIYAALTSMQVVNSTFTDDRASGADVTDSQTANAGSIYSSASSNVLQGVRITGARAQTSGPVGQDAAGGGALFEGTVSIIGSVFNGDVASGTTTSNNEVFVTGGALMLEPQSTAKISRTTIEGSTASASSPENSAYAEGGGVFSYGGLSIAASTLSGNKASAVSGAIANATGGGLMVSSQVHATTATDSTIANNAVSAMLTKNPGPSPLSIGTGGGVQDESEQLAFRYDTISGNVARATSGSQGGGLDVSTGLALPNPRTVATIWAGNVAGTGPQCDGAFTSSGWNWFGSLGSCGTATKSSDQTHGHLRLGSLASNGGPTKTAALKAGSGALDRIPRATCRAVIKADQRGVSRPQGAAKKATKRRCDIGAYERTVRHRHHH
ncbi:MAG TPA: choice-of-anchor Q domain-containing protein [Mycobacteriales bacterium]|nr:choice-of-anchor Q domain-containing protein [Mycobacteriales bacterium]